MVYPIAVRSMSMDHQSGTKQYHLMLIQNAGGKCVVINRWGKTGAFGEIKADCYGTVQQAEREFEKKERAKTRNGYSPTGPSKSVEAPNAGELSRTIGIAAFNKMGANAVSHLDPGYDTSKMRDADPNRLDENGRLTGEDKPRAADLSAELEEMKRKDAEEAATAYANHENFGRF